jgi:hypothetical protein
MTLAMYPRAQTALGALAIAVALAFAGDAPAQVTPAGTSRAGPSFARAVNIQVNGRALATGVALRGGDSEEVWVAVSALQRAVDGVVTTASSRMRLEGTRLSAIGIGGCEACPAKVARTVLISNRARALDGVFHVPLLDVVTALEGRVEPDERRTTYGIYVGKCTWCILEPR